MKLRELIDKRLIETITSFTRKAGISRPTYYSIMRGERVSVTTARKVCHYFGVDWKDYVD